MPSHGQLVCCKTAGEVLRPRLGEIAVAGEEVNPGLVGKGVQMHRPGVEESCVGVSVFVEIRGNLGGAGGVFEPQPLEGES